MIPITSPRVPGNSDLFLTPQQREIAVGTLLGDASLQTQSGGKTWRLKWQMGLKHADYANHICQEFGDRWIPSKPHTIKRLNSEMLGFQTLASVNLTGLTRLFLEGREKTLVKVYKPGLIRDHLTDRGLAYWFMDDGGKDDYTPNQGKGITLNTHGFEEQGVIAICQELAERFKLEAKPRPNKGRHVVLISGRFFERFEELVTPYLVESMRAKMPSPRVQREGKRREKRVDDIV
jgi:hypothetical protein